MTVAQLLTALSDLPLDSEVVIEESPEFMFFNHVPLNYIREMVVTIPTNTWEEDEPDERTLNAVVLTYNAS